MSEGRQGKKERKRERQLMHAEYYLKLMYVDQVIIINVNLLLMLIGESHHASHKWVALL